VKKPKSNQTLPLFGDRFLEQYAGPYLLGSPKVAIMELIANSWDAGASEVSITWPENDGDKFSIVDNGHGMTESQFMTRFRTLSYDREKAQGLYAEVPTGNDVEGLRTVFGKNGKGRFAGFAFGKSFFVKTWRDGKENTFKVFKKDDNNLRFKKVGDTIFKDGHGTEIYVDFAQQAIMSDEQARSEIGMRFLVDPKFHVFLNGTQIEFSDIPAENVSTIDVPVDGVGNITITIVDVKATDKTTHQHGVAWLVNKRLVGECSWKGAGYEYLTDGRKIAAKRYTFLVDAEILNDKRAVLPDWTGFYPNNDSHSKSYEAVNKAIKSYLLELTKDSRIDTFNSIKQENIKSLKNMGLISREKWEHFVKEVQEDCPSIAENDLHKLASIMAKLENSSSQFNLISQLSTMEADQLDNLSVLLEKWNIDAAKVVLDELEFRLKLLEQLRMKVLKETTEEVGELQPLFHRGLWIFGPEYETIEYTSNETMTSVIQKLYNSDAVGTNVRPDFAILPDSTVGLYSYPKYDIFGGEIGIDKLTIVELKKPGVPIGKEEKNQAWKYVKELLQKGFIKGTQVTCFVLGATLDEYESSVTTELDGLVVIQPMAYDTVVARAKSRLLKLHERVKGAPFLQQVRLDEYLHEKAQTELML
jgi:hypothetical protein